MPPSTAKGRGRALTRGGRAVIEQAKGMMMALSPGLTPDEAFDLLRKASQRENVNLRLIAQRIVERRSPKAGQPDGGAS